MEDSCVWCLDSGLSLPPGQSQRGFCVKSTERSCERLLNATWFNFGSIHPKIVSMFTSSSAPSPKLYLYNSEFIYTSLKKDWIHLINELEVVEASRKNLRRLDHSC